MKKWFVVAAALVAILAIPAAYAAASSNEKPKSAAQAQAQTRAPRSLQGGARVDGRRRIPEEVRH